MNIYKVDYRSYGHLSKGFSFHSSKAEANKAGRDAVEHGKDSVDEGVENFSVDLIHVKPTRQGIIRALTIHASHPDNG